MKKLVLAFFILFGQELYAQQLPYFNPFVSADLYNPAFVGSQGYSEVWLVHRRQWAGIEGAPMSSAVHLQLPMNSGLSLGLTAVDDRQSLFVTTIGRATASYLIPLGHQHELSAGLSFGAGKNSLDGNSTDPAALAIMDQPFFLSGGAGIRYRFRGLQLGAALPQLAQADQFDQTDAELVAFRPDRYYLFSGKYRLNLGSIGIEPQALYRMGAGLPSQYEAAATVYYRQLAWLGGAYREESSMSAWAGFQLGKTLRLNYAYEVAANADAASLGATHEVMLALRFGKRKRAQALAEKEEELLAQEVAAEVEEEAETPEEVETESDSPSEGPSQDISEENTSPEIEENLQTESLEEDVEEIDIAPTWDTSDDQEDQQVQVSKSGNPMEMAPGYYVVVGAFSVITNVERYQKALEAQGYEGEYGYSSKTNLYYLYLKQSVDLSSARQRYAELRQQPMFQDTWVLGVKPTAR